MKKRKLTTRQKAINRIQRRLKTLEKNGVTIKVKPTKKNIEEILKANQVKITKNNANGVVKEFVDDAQYTTRETAKEIKKTFGLSKISDVQKLTGQELHDKFAEAFDEDEDLGDEVLSAYGYSH